MTTAQIFMAIILMALASEDALLGIAWLLLGVWVMV